MILFCEIKIDLKFCDFLSYNTVYYVRAFK